jgi:hypothetical protein
MYEYAVNCFVMVKVRKVRPCSPQQCNSASHALAGMLCCDPSIEEGRMSDNEQNYVLLRIWHYVRHYVLLPRPLTCHCKTSRRGCCSTKQVEHTACVSLVQRVSVHCSCCVISCKSYRPENNARTLSHITTFLNIVREHYHMQLHSRI